ncbi:MAG: adenylosuccinate synthetase, partial [Owenweeksia sp.]
SIDDDLVKPVYKEMAGWTEDLTQLENYDDAPQSLKDYIEFLQQELGVPVTILSVGPNRSQTIQIESHPATA